MKIANFLKLLQLTSTPQYESFVEKFEFAELIRLIELNDAVSSDAQEVMEQKLAGKTIVFGTPYMQPSIKHTYVQEENDFIRIQNFAVASKVLQNFGHFIHSLRIDEYFLDDKAKEIYRLVNLHCSETLKKIHLRNSMEDFSNEFTKPFNHVEIVQLEGDLKNLADLELKISKLFPQMHQLILGQVKIYNTKSIEIEFPQLRSFDVEVFGHDVEGRITDNVVQKIFEKNPQLKNLVLKNASSKLVMTAKNVLTNLETLLIP